MSTEVLSLPSLNDGSQINHQANESKRSSMTDVRSDGAEPRDAVSKHSLFGCSLEMKTDAEKQDLQKIDLKGFEEQQEVMRADQRARYLPTLPNDVTKNLPVTKLLEASKISVAKQLEDTERARNDVTALMKRRQFFEVENPIPRVCREETTESANVTLISRPSLRNPFKPYTDNFCRNLGGCESGHKYSYKRHHGPDWLPSQAFIRKKSDMKSAITTVDLPRNIQHMFGTNVCLSVLSDKDKVGKSLQFQRKHLANQPIVTSPSTSLSLERNPQYESLGHATRYNIVPGYSYGPFESCSKRVHAHDVYDRKTEDPQQYKHQTDAVSHWAEHNVIRGRIDKAWDSYHAERKSKNS